MSVFRREAQCQFMLLARSESGWQHKFLRAGFPIDRYQHGVLSDLEAADKDLEFLGFGFVPCGRKCDGDVGFLTRSKRGAVNQSQGTILVGPEPGQLEITGSRLSGTSRFALGSLGYLGQSARGVREEGIQAVRNICGEHRTGHLC